MILDIALAGIMLSPSIMIIGFVIVEIIEALKGKDKDK